MTLTADRLKDIAAKEYARIHGPGHSADWVLGYQACAKAIVEAVKKEGALE